MTRQKPCKPTGGFINRQGYGQKSVRIAGKVTTQYAHRAAWEQHHGRPLPKGMTVDHTCVTPTCIEPTHLEAVTHGENIKRRWIRQRARQNKAAT